MVSEEYFRDLVNDLFSDYLPKVEKAQKKIFIAAMVEELTQNGLEFEEYEETEAEIEYITPAQDLRNSDND